MSCRRVINILTALCLGIGVNYGGAVARAEGPSDAPFGVSIGKDVFVIPHLQYRFRFIGHDGKDFKKDTSYDAMGHRARLGLEAQVFKHFRAMVQVQDARVWGEELSPTEMVADGFDLYQAWVQGTTPCGRLTLRVGRQPMSYDNERLLGLGDWTDGARAFDAVRFMWESNGFSAHLFWSMLGEEDAYATTKDSTGADVVTRGSKTDRHLFGLWLNYKKIEPFRPSVLFLYDRDGVLLQDRVTLGTYIDGMILKAINYSAEYYLQSGSKGGLPVDSKTILAHMFALHGGYTAPVAWKPMIELWVEWLSGDNDSTDDFLSTFSTLHGTNHKFYGYMDFFTDIPKHTAGLGLVDFGARLKATPKTGLSVWVDYHYFTFAKAHVTGGTTRTRNLGHEIDLVGNYAFNQYISLQSGFATFLPKRGITCAQGSGTCSTQSLDPSYWGYVMGNIVF